MSRIVSVGALGILGATMLGAATPLRPFTVADDIGCALFDTFTTGIALSPDGKRAAVMVERGLLAENRVENELRVYDLAALQSYVNSEASTGAPEPAWAFAKHTHRESPIISEVTWLPDSQRLAFLVRAKSGRRQLWLAELRSQQAWALTPLEQDVIAFDCRDATHFVYMVRNLEGALDKFDPDKVSGYAVDGQSFFSLMRAPAYYQTMRNARSELWAACGGAPFPVCDAASGRPIVIYRWGISPVALAPDGNRAVIALPLAEVPADWDRRFPPPSKHLQNQVLHHARQDLNAASAGGYASVYALVDLTQGKVTRLVDAPISYGMMWALPGRMIWSREGESVFLPGTFLPDRSDEPPCFAFVRPRTGAIEYVAPLKSDDKERTTAAQFDPNDPDRVVVETADMANWSLHYVSTYMRRDGKWALQKTEAREGNPVVNAAVGLSIKEGMNEPPELVATDKATRASRAVWNPNPQLAEIALGEESLYHWKDVTGREWTGGLYKPADFIPGKRYPLVVQTHGFLPKQFNPSGAFTTGSAARAMAASGMVVLQAPDLPNIYSGSPDEAPAHLRGYAGAIAQLAAEGVIEPDRVGLIGFSRTCLFVMHALTVHKLNLRAAEITEGVDGGYFQYLMSIDAGTERDGETQNGGAPFGDGLRSWLAHSPGFNLDKVTVPLRIVSGPPGTEMLGEWEPYALLRRLHKPVDLIVLNKGPSEHVLTNPGTRLLSQGGAVDWFRFWLKDEEDPDPKKADQYARWRKLRELRDTDASKVAAPAGKN